MISYDAIIVELQKQAQQAQQAPSAQQKREALAAIRALCDVALQNGELPTTPTATPSFVPKQQPVQTPPTITTENKLHEPDANGDSLFDF